MRAVVFRRRRLDGDRSWRPRSLTDMRGARFPDEYNKLLVLDAEDITEVFDGYPSKLGDVIIMGEDDELQAFVAAPFGWESVKFGSEWRSPE